MKNRVYKIKELKVDKYHGSYKLGSLNHCKLQFFIEEFQMLGNFNVFTVGTGECSYYALKTKYQDGLINATYALSNSEIIFGDLSKVEEQIDKFSELPTRTIILMTCIPSIMNLDLKEYISQYPNKFILFMIPEFSGYNALDYLPEIYYEVYKDFRCDYLEEKESLWDKEFYKDEEILTMLKNKRQRVKNRKYLKLINHLSTYLDYEIIDQSTFSYDDFISYLKEKDEINELGLFISNMLKKERIILLSSYYLEFVSILKMNKINIDKIILNSISKASIDYLKAIDEELNVEFNDSLVYLNLDDNQKLDTLSFDYDTYELDVNEAMLNLIRRINHGNE